MVANATMKKASSLILRGLFCMQNNGETLKEFELINKFTSKMTEIPSQIEVKAYLSKITYSDFMMGYENTIVKRNDKFISNVTIDMLYQIYWLDITLSDLLLKYTLEIEKLLKAQLLTVISKFGDTPSRYLDKRKYTSRGGALHKIESYMQEDRDGIFKGFLDKHEIEYIPSWFLIQHLTFGMAINLFSILKPPHKKIIIDTIFSNVITPLPISEKKELLRSILAFALELRNKTAHGNKLLGIKFDEDINTLKKTFTKLGIETYLKKSNKGVIIANISNFIILILLFSNIPLFAVNMVNEFSYFFKQNSNEENNILSVLNKNTYDLLKKKKKDVDNIKKLFSILYKRK